MLAKLRPKRESHIAPKLWETKILQAGPCFCLRQQASSERG